MDLSTVTQAVSKVTDFQAKKQGWTDWMAKPENRAFLLQTGIALAQNPAPGQSQFGNMMNAIGAGAAAKDRYIEGQTKAAQDKADLQTRQAQTDNAKARTALDAKQLNLDERKLAAQEANNKSMNAYRQQLGLSAVLRAQKPSGRAPKTMDENWQKYLIESFLPLYPDATPEEIASAKETFMSAYDVSSQGDPSAAASSTDTGVSSAPAQTATDPKTGKKVMWNGSSWVPM